MNIRVFALLLAAGPVASLTTPVYAAERFRVSLQLRPEPIESELKPYPRESGLRGVFGARPVEKQAMRDLSARLQRIKDIAVVRDSEDPQVILTLLAETFSSTPDNTLFPRSSTLLLQADIVGDSSNQSETIKCGGRDLKSAINGCEKDIHKWLKGVRAELKP